jgi:hypothetical protein
LSAEVRKIGLVTAEVNEPAAELLNEVMERIASGETVAIALIEVRKGHSVATDWSENGQYHLLNSGAARLAARLASEVDE